MSGPIESFYQGLEQGLNEETPPERMSLIRQLSIAAEETYRAGQHAKMRLKLASRFMAQAASRSGVQTFVAEAFCQSRFTLADASLSYADVLLARWKETTPPVNHPDQLDALSQEILDLSDVFADEITAPADSEGGEV